MLPIEKLKEFAEKAGLAEAADVREGFIYPRGMEEFARLVWEEGYETGHDEGYEQAILKERG